MIRIILLLMLIGLFLAVRYLPLWALISLPLVFVLLLYFSRGKLLEMLFSIPFRMKGRVLRRAEVKVNSIRSIPTPRSKSNSEDEVHDSDDWFSNGGDVDFYELDVVISPKQTKGPFHLWEPNELRLATLQSRLGSDEVCRISNLQVIADTDLDEKRRTFLGSTEIIEERKFVIEQDRDNGREDEEGNASKALSTYDPNDDDLDAQGDKFFGPQRLKLNIAVRREVKKLVFRYYFEKFGSVTIP